LTGWERGFGAVHRPKPLNSLNCRPTKYDIEQGLIVLHWASFEKKYPTQLPNTQTAVCYHYTAFYFEKMWLLPRNVVFNGNCLLFLPKVKMTDGPKLIL
jgi:hypothetical protein